MIAVDTSALITIVLDEPRAEDLQTRLADENVLLVSAGTLTECRIVALQRRVLRALDQLLNDLQWTVTDVDEATSRRIGDIYGRGNHPAKLNFGDCFAYDVAKQNNCRSSSSANDFAQTDIVTPSEPVYSRFR